MDKLQTLLQSLENEFQIDTTPTQEDVATTVDSNLKRLQAARAEVQEQLDEAFQQIVGYIRFTRAATESLISLREHIDDQIAVLQKLPSSSLKVG